jgi:hypothetical protein
MSHGAIISVLKSGLGGDFEQVLANQIRDAIEQEGTNKSAGQ